MLRRFGESTTGADTLAGFGGKGGWIPPESVAGSEQNTQGSAGAAPVRGRKPHTGARSAAFRHVEVAARPSPADRAKLVDGLPVFVWGLDALTE